MAPAHMAQGSSVTYSRQPESRQPPSAAAAARIASISAWAVGSPVASRRLRPRAMIFYGTFALAALWHAPRGTERLLARFSPRTAPDDATVILAIEKSLGSVDV